LASKELAKGILAANLRSGCVQAGFQSITHLVRISHSVDKTPYFGGTGKSDHEHSFGFQSLPIMLVVIMIEIKRL
jgi:hypothetical protein